MKQLESPHPLLLLCVGYPGAGKSTFARQLAETYGFGWIHDNRLRHTLFAKPNFSPSEEELVGELAEYMLRELLRTKGHIIFDANAATLPTRQKLEKLGRDASYTVLVIWVQTDMQTAFSRAKRTREEEYSVALTRTQFDVQASRLGVPSPQEMSIVLSGKHTFATQVRALVRKIDSLFHPTVVQPPPKTAKRNIPVSDVVTHTHPSTPPGRSRPRFHITRRIKFR